MRWRKKTSGSLKPGDVFDKYTVEKLLGHGGMGAVYLVRHPVLDSHFALKVLFPDVAAKKRQFVDRFIREAKLACKVKHPNLIAVHDAGQEKATGLYYIVMDYVSGGSLHDRLKKEPRLRPAEALRIITGVAEALSAAHAHHMIHRDIKPANIMFAADGTVKLADLGIAKSTDEKDAALTMASAIFGTPAYMSPEQAKDSGKVDARADIYSLGIVFYEMLAGQRPYRGDSSMQILSQVVAETPVPDIRSLCPQTPPELAELITDMTAKELDRRIPDADTLLKRLQSIRLPVPDPAEAADAEADCDTQAATIPMVRQPAAPGTPAAAPVADAGPEKAVGPEEEAGPEKPAGPARGKSPVVILSAIGAGLSVFLLLAGLAVYFLWANLGGKPTTPARTPVLTISGETVAASGGKQAETPVKAETPEPPPKPEAASPRKRILLLAGDSPEARAVETALNRSFGEKSVSFQPVDDLGGYKRNLQDLIATDPSLVILGLAEKYASQKISRSGFENVIRYYADQLHDHAIPYLFILSPETGGDARLRELQEVVREIGKLKSIPVVTVADPADKELQKLIAELRK